MKTVKRFKLFLYRQVWQITEMSDGAVFKTKLIGNISSDLESELDTDRFVCSNYSPSITADFDVKEVTLDPFFSSVEELEDYLKEVDDKKNST